MASSSPAPTPTLAEIRAAASAVGAQTSASTPSPSPTLASIRAAADAARGAEPAVATAPAPTPTTPSEPTGLAGIGSILSKAPAALGELVTSAADPTKRGLANVVSQMGEDVIAGQAGDQSARHRIGARQLTASLALAPLGSTGALVGAATGALGGYTDATIAGQDPTLPVALGTLFGAGGGAIAARAATTSAASLARRAAVEVATAAQPIADTAEARVLAAINAAPKVYARQEQLRSVERARRLATGAQAASSRTGRAAAEARLSAHAGTLPKVHFESIAQAIAPGDVDELFSRVNTSAALSEYDRLTASKALMNLFSPHGGRVPVPNELDKLRRVFGPQFVSTLLDKRSTLQRITAVGSDLINAPRAIMSSLDLSAPLRQGLFLLPSQPRAWGRAFASMFRYAGSERAFTELERNIRSRPSFLLMQRSGLALSDMSMALGGREEAFASQLVERIPIAGGAIRASNRAYTGFLNKLRADTFDNLLNATRHAGIDPATSPTLTADIANFINSATGRGDLGKLESHAGLLSTGLFSPRLIASRVRLLNPYTYLNPATHPLVRRQYIKSSLGLAGGVATVLGAAKLSGATVETDIESPDWGKMRFGSTRYDLTGGFAPYLRTSARILTRIPDIVSGNQRGSGDNAWTIGERFTRGKLNPAVSFAVDMLKGKDFSGQPFNLPRAALSRLTPMLTQDITDAVREYGAPGVATIAPAVFGVGVQTYQ